MSWTTENIITFRRPGSFILIKRWMISSVRLAPNRVEIQTTEGPDFSLFDMSQDMLKSAYASIIEDTEPTHWILDVETDSVDTDLWRRGDAPWDKA